MIQYTNRKVILYFILAGMAELADAPDLGSGISDVQVQVLLPAPPAVPAPKYRGSALLFFVYHTMVKFRYEHSYQRISYLTLCSAQKREIR